MSGYIVGDKDLVFLGMAATLLARYHMRRKGGRVPLEGFPHSDRDAGSFLLKGMELGYQVPLDDVPGLSISVDGDNEGILRLVAQCEPEWPDSEVIHLSGAELMGIPEDGWTDEEVADFRDSLDKDDEGEEWKSQ